MRVLEAGFFMAPNAGAVAASEPGNGVGASAPTGGSVACSDEQTPIDLPCHHSIKEGNDVRQKGKKK